MPRFQANSPSFSSNCVSAPPATAPSLAQAENRQAVLRSTSSMQSASVMPIAADAIELDQFAFDHHLGEADQQIENVEIAFAQRDLKRLHVEPVAGEHAGVIAPLHVGGRAAAAGLRHVDHVVMDERGGVDHFHDRAELDGGLR